MKLSNKKGFTLIELVVVIVIIGILAMLVVPKVTQFQTEASYNTCQGNKRTLAAAQSMLLLKTPGATALEPADLKAAGFINDVSCPDDKSKVNNTAYKAKTGDDAGTYECLVNPTGHNTTTTTTGE